MKAHKRLWNKATRSWNNPTNWQAPHITTDKEFAEMNQPVCALDWTSLKADDTEVRMWMMFFALYFEGELEV